MAWTSCMAAIKPSNGCKECKFLNQIPTLTRSRRFYFGVGRTRHVLNFTYCCILSKLGVVNPFCDGMPLWWFRMQCHGLAVLPLLRIWRLSRDRMFKHRTRRHNNGCVDDVIARGPSIICVSQCMFLTLRIVAFLFDVAGRQPVLRRNASLVV